MSTYGYNILTPTIERITDIMEYLDGKPDMMMYLVDALLLITYIRAIKPRTILELGTGGGGSGMLIMSEYPKAKFITVDKSDGEDIGKHLLEGAIRLKKDFHKDLSEILKEYKPELVYYDPPSINEICTKKVLQECHKYGIKWVIIHNAHKESVRGLLGDNKYYLERAYYGKVISKEYPLSIGISVLRRKS